MPGQPQQPSLTARMMRSLRMLSYVRGFMPIANRLTPHVGEFVVRNKGQVFAGKLDSYIDRMVYMTGGYEREYIAPFLSMVPKKRIILDIGANAGTHTVAFGQAFQTVHAFEPHPVMFAQLQRNIALNHINAIAHPIGLGEEAGSFPLYESDSENKGLTTFLIDELDADRRTEAVRARVETADSLNLPDEIDAVKIDVQGFEAQVLRGMQGLLARNKPVIWLEITRGTQVASIEDIRSLVPYPVRVFRFERRARLLNSVVLVEVTGETGECDVLVIPT